MPSTTAWARIARLRPAPDFQAAQRDVAGRPASSGATAERRRRRWRRTPRPFERRRAGLPGAGRQLVTATDPKAVAHRLTRHFPRPVEDEAERPAGRRRSTSEAGAHDQYATIYSRTRCCDSLRCAGDRDAARRPGALRRGDDDGAPLPEQGSAARPEAPEAELGCAIIFATPCALLLHRTAAAGAGLRRRHRGAAVDGEIGAPPTSTAPRRSLDEPAQLRHRYRLVAIAARAVLEWPLRPAAAARGEDGDGGTDR